MEADSLRLGIRNETDWLVSVVLGIADKMGPEPEMDSLYDPTSKEHLLSGRYPREEDMVKELECFERILKKHGVEVHRPRIIEGCNQLFARDIAFVVDRILFRSNILPMRENEFKALDDLVDRLPQGQVCELPEEVHVEGGDVMPWNEYLFVGTYTGSDYPNYITARTNRAAVDFLTQKFPKRKVIALELIKSNTDPENNALHLDCCFQPVGTDKAIICPGGFQRKEDYLFLSSLFPKGHVFEVSREEMARMYCNVFSISPEVVVTEVGFHRLNAWLEEMGFKLESIPFSEISKQGGLLRCTTLPLQREG